MTAAFVAALRGLGDVLPDDVRLVDDPFGAGFAGPGLAQLAALAGRLPHIAGRALLLVPPLAHTILWMQLRTRTLDDALVAFARAGGRQVLLLGAGFDCRAARFRDALADGVVYEVDHPATQAKKREVLERAGAESARVAYLAWDFERERMADLPSRLAALGHDPVRPTLTLWEGVTMYLTPDAIESTVDAVRALSGPGSRLVMTYFDRRRLDRPLLENRLMGAIVNLVGEPFRFGWIPEELPGWLAARGFTVVDDVSDADLARRHFPRRYARIVESGWRRIATTERIATASRAEA